MGCPCSSPVDPDEQSLAPARGGHDLNSYDDEGDNNYKNNGKKNKPKKPKRVQFIDK
jgi:hypothetical protein